MQMLLFLKKENLAFRVRFFIIQTRFIVLKPYGYVWKIMDYSGDSDHLPKTIGWETIKKVEEILQMTGWKTTYDRPEDDGQSLLAHKTPGSKIAAKKYGGKPSRERHSGD